MRTVDLKDLCRFFSSNRKRENCKWNNWKSIETQRSFGGLLKSSNWSDNQKRSLTSEDEPLIVAGESIVVLNNVLKANWFDSFGSRERERENRYKLLSNWRIAWAFGKPREPERIVAFMALLTILMMTRVRNLWIIWNHSKPFGIIWNHSKQFGFFWNHRTRWQRIGP